MKISRYSDLPDGWLKTTISNLVCEQGVFRDGDWVESKDQDPNGVVRLIQLADIGDGEFRDKSARFLTDDKAIELNCTFLEMGDILVARMPDPLGRACLFPLSGARKFVTVVDVCVIRFGHDYLNAKYFMYLLNSPNSRKEVSDLQTGSTRKRISRGNLSTIRFPIAPLNEQHRIVAKIDELFSELDKGIENLMTAQTQLKVYRQALLKHAFEGKLTAQWRAENQDKLETAEALLKRIQQERTQRYQQQLAEWEYAISVCKAKGGKKPTKPRSTLEADKPSSEHRRRMWDIPDGWQWLQIGNFAFVTKLAGFEYTKYVRYAENGDLPVIKAENAGPNGYRRTQYSRVHSSSVAELTRSHLHGGELLMVFVGAGTGNVATVPVEQRFFLGPNIGMMRIESDAVNARYVEFFLRSPHGRNLALASVKAVAQPSLSMGTIRQIPVALPSRREQDEIVAQVEGVLSIIDKTESEIEVQISKAELLRQSILKRAFSGQLVPQDPNDEPASALLARIKAEKASQSDIRRGRI